MTSRRAHFVWWHIVCFSYEPPAGRFNFEFVQTYSNYTTSIWLGCLISRAPLAGATPKISSENYTNTAESISNEPGVLIPHVHCLGSAIIAFSVVQTRRAASTNKPKIWYLHWDELYTALPLQWRHMSAMASGSTNRTVCFSAAFPAKQHTKFTVNTGTRHEYHGITNQWQFECWFHSLTE